MTPSPGRELDALIAEKVMGYTKKLVPAYSLPNIDIPEARFPRQDSWLYINAGGYPDYFEGHVNDMFSDASRGIRQTLTSVPPYSTDISAAWEVVEKLSEQGIFLRLSSISGAGKWRCYMLGMTPYVDTAPHAICLAALRAVGWEG